MWQYNLATMAVTKTKTTTKNEQQLEKSFVSQ